MFDFRKEVIINSDTLPVEDGGHTRVTNDGTLLRVLRCADYELGKIKNFVKVQPVAGTASTVVVNMDGAVENAVSYELVIKIGLDEHRMHGEFANDWAKYEKTLRAESATHDGLKAALLEVLKANPILVEKENNTFECKDLHQIIKSAVVNAYDANDVLLKETDLAPKKGVRPVNTGDLLIENLRFPSYPNLRYAAQHEEERPIPGKLYNLYVFDYVAPRVGLHGQGAVGQQLVSSTVHAFYVLDGLAANDEFAKLAPGEDGTDEVPVAGE